MSIKIKDITELLDKYLKGIGCADLKLVRYEDKEILFEKILKDYKEGEISLDELSSLSETVWWTLSEKEKTDKFGKILMSGMELNFYERNANDDSGAKNFIYFLQEVLEYKKQENNSESREKIPSTSIIGIREKRVKNLTESRR